MPLFDWRKLISLIPACLFLIITSLFYRPNLGKACLIIFMSLMPLISSFQSKAYQLNRWPCDLYNRHRNMLVAELTVSHRTSFIKFRLWPCLVHFIGPWSIWLSAVTIITGGASLCILSPLPNSFVSREISYWLRLVMVLWLKSVAPRWNRRPPVGDQHMVALLGTHWYHR